MNEQVMIYEIKSSASSNSDSLFHPNGKYFYWNQKKFNNLKLGDYVLVVNTHSQYVLFTKVNLKDIPVGFNDKQNISFFKDQNQRFEIIGKWDDFVRLEIISKNPTPNNWRWKSLGSSETTYLNGNRIDSSNSNRILNITQLKELSGESDYQKILNDCLINFKTESEGFSSELFKFIDQAETDNLKFKHFKKNYLNTKVKVSFGQGTLTKIPWISFLIGPNKTSDGIYPVYLYFKDIRKLILAYGISETKTPTCKWNIQNPKTIGEYFEENNYEKPFRYGTSYLFKSYDVSNIKNVKSLDDDLKEIVNIYNENLKRNKMTEKYSWVKTHKELVIYLKDQQGNQIQLINILKKAGATIFNDKVGEEKTIIELDEIDPFTFFCYIYKYGPDMRLQILQNIATNLNLSVPNDEKGVPSANPQRVWLFPYKFKRNNNEIPRLWQFFYSALENKISDEQFEDILKIKGIAHAKITEALFYVNPEKYFPLNGPTKPFLQEELGVNPDFNTFSEYENILSQIRGKTDKPFYQISHEAWLLSDSPKQENSFDLNVLIESVVSSGLSYSNLLIKRFVSSLITKPFVILTGLSGSGKTKLAQAFVQWICKDDSQYRIIPVGADWTNREPLLGYPNALKPEEYVKPDSGVLDLVIQANNHQGLPHFLILDEMNLSHVERYFADFLSVMESKEEIRLYAEGKVNSGIPAKLQYPSNLFIIGTVNIDETTNMFSPKVLDRANTIEFRVTDEEMQDFLENISDINMLALNAKGAGMAKSFLQLAENRSFETIGAKVINGTLVRFFGQLKKSGAEFGYRSASEIIRLINQLTVIDDSLSENEKMDIAIMQKLLPKLHGSRRKLCPVLISLGSFCADEDLKVEKDVFEKDDFDFNGSKVRYPLSLEKIARMYRGAIDNGFASFAEA